MELGSRIQILAVQLISKVRYWANYFTSLNLASLAPLENEMMKMFLPDLTGDSLGGFNNIVLVKHKVHCPAYRKPINVNHITVLSEDKCPLHPRLRY